MPPILPPVIVITLGKEFFSHFFRKEEIINSPSAYGTTIAHALL